MRESDGGAYETTPITTDDVTADLRCGKPPLDDFFRKHALENDRRGIGRTYVLRSGPSETLPKIIGYYTICMASIPPELAAGTGLRRLPKYHMPVALIGRLARDERANGVRAGERLLIDALRRIVDVAEVVGCIGIIVDAKDANAEAFYRKYDFETVEDASWPRRMFMRMEHARAAFAA